MLAKKTYRGQFRYLTHTHTYTQTKMETAFPFICDTWPDTKAKTQGFCRVRDRLTQVWL